MGENPGVLKGRTTIGFAITVLLTVLFATLVSGCAPDTPEAATKAFYSAIENGDWNAYIDSILPENVRRMTPDETNYQEESVKEAGVTFKGLKFKTKYTNEEKTTAEVSIVAGEMAQKNPSTGEKEVITIEEVIEQSGGPPTVQLVKYRNRWYVDVPLAQSDLQEQSGAQVEEQPPENQAGPNQQ